MEIQRRPIGKFLYLTRAEWADAWVNGGTVPIEPASTYWSLERAGTRTPDELLQHRSPVDLRTLPPAIRVRDVQGLTIQGAVIDGVRLPDLQDVDFYREDGLVLCFSDVEDADIARRLGNKAVCVYVADLERLRRKLDRQLGCKGTMQSCQYTATHERSHFLKGVEDAWQQEYRVFWKRARRAEVQIPAGTGRVVARYTY